MQVNCLALGNLSIMQKPILWAAHHCVGGSNPNACERSLASHAIYMLIQYTPLLVEKAGVAPEVNLRNPLCAGEEACKWGNPPWLWNPGQTSPEVQNRGISGPTKRTCVLQKIFKKKKPSCLNIPCKLQKICFGKKTYFTQNTCLLWKSCVVADPSCIETCFVWKSYLVWKPVLCGNPILHGNLSCVKKTAFVLTLFTAKNLA